MDKEHRYRFAYTDLQILYGYSFTDTDFLVQFYRYRFTDKDILIHIYRYMYADKDLQRLLQIYDTNTQIQIYILTVTYN